MLKCGRIQSRRIVQKTTHTMCVTFYDALTYSLFLAQFGRKRNFFSLAIEAQSILNVGIERAGQIIDADGIIAAGSPMPFLPYREIRRLVSALGQIFKEKVVAVV